MKLGEMMGKNPIMFFSIIISVVVICILVLVVIIILKSRSEKNIIKAAVKLKNIIDYLSVGIVRFYLDGDYKINYANKNFYSILGFTYEESIEEGKTHIVDFISLRKQEEFLEFIKKLSDYSNETDQARIETIIIDKDNKEKYVLFTGKMDNEHDQERMFSATIIDITEQKILERKIDLERERYMLTAEFSENIFFEYQVGLDIMGLSGNYQDFFGERPIIEKFSDYLVNNNKFINHDDWGLFLDFHKAIVEEKDIVEREFRIKNSKDEFTWCQVKARRISRPDQASKVMGRIINVDMYKSAIHELEYKVTIDPLTSVYNRESIRNSIGTFLSENDENTHGFLFLDFDDFKQVNDNYGHLMGDKVLVHVANLMKEIFKGDEMVGRIGGDEFLVFVGNLKDKSELLEKAENLRKVTDTIYKEQEVRIQISVSIGVSMYPYDGRNYESLLAKADEALYKAKEEGKNKFVLFENIE